MSTASAPPQIRLFNTLTRRKEDFVPLEDGQVGIYACGVTVYDRCHLGHAMQAIVFDVIVRYLRFRGFDVTYVRNHTDVDDKVIQRAQELGRAPLDLSEEMVELEERDMAALGVVSPDHAPKVSDYIPQIVAFIGRLVENGSAYATEKGNVYFRVTSKDDYGKLSGRRIDELEVGTRKAVESDKEDPRDFALWKAETAEGAWWESPFGRGRPGWHIECSVMSHELLGDPFDIHGGGLDLIFPHHENEIAQSEAFCGEQHVRHWVHNGLLTVRKEKMSKSSGNFFTIEDALARFGAELIRFVILQYHYRSNPDFAPSMMATDVGRLHALYEHAQEILADVARIEAAGELRIAADVERIEGAFGDEVRKRLATLDAEFVSAMDDDFGTPEALVLLADAIKYAAECRKRKKTAPAVRARAARAVWSEVQRLGGVLGLFQRDPTEFLAETKQRFLSAGDVDAGWIDERIAARAAARANKDWALADAARDELAARGVELRDGPDGTGWAVGREALERLYS